jgi:hypothetical protein
VSILCRIEEWFQDILLKKLKTLTWPALQQRRLKTKLIMFYKIVHYIVAVPTTILIPTDPRIRQFHPFTSRHHRYACDFIFVLEVLRFLFKNRRLLFALATKLLACCVHFMSNWRVIPRYFAEETDSKIGSCSFSGIY